MTTAAGRGLVAVNGSQSIASRTGALAAVAADLYESGEVLHLATLDAAGLLGRARSPDVEAALAAVGTAEVLLVATPVYRRTYSGLLKTFFDLMKPEHLAGVPVVLVATGGGVSDALCIDYGLRPLVASVGGWAVPRSVYATHGDFDDELSPRPAIEAQLSAALDEARRLVAQLAAS